MSERLKNCPSCGGTLDDNGRCPYCNSKVYDLTDINIDVNSHDRIKLKLKCGDNTVIMDCYPASLSWAMECDDLSTCDYNCEGFFLKRNPCHRITLELISY